MGQIIRNAIVAAGIAGSIAIGMATPSQAQHYRYGPRVHVSPHVYRGYAYAPGYYGYRDIPQYDTSGQAFSTRELGWQGGLPGGAPSNPCHFGQRMQNRC